MIPGKADRRAARMREAYRVNAPDILRYFDRRVSVAEDEADLMAETMLVAWRRNGRLPTQPEGARMWLFQIAKYTLLNYRRGRRRHMAAAEVLRNSVAHTRPAEELQKLDDQEDVRRAIESLPEDQAEMIRLVHWDGFTVAEVARLIGASLPASIRRLTHRFPGRVIHSHERRPCQQAPCGEPRDDQLA